LCEIDHDCPHIHHVKPQYPGDAGDVDLYKLGHPLPCATDSCHSKLRILRAASVHYPLLRKFLYSVYNARKCHNLVTQVDEALHAANFDDLCGLINICDYQQLIDDDNNTLADEKSDKSDEGFIAEGLPNLETQLRVVHALAIEECNKKLKDDPEHVCVSCHR